MSCILSAVSISMLMALCTRVLSLAYIITPTSTSSLPNLPVHHQRYSLLNAATMALRLRRWAGAALSAYHLQALDKSVACTVSMPGAGLCIQHRGVSLDVA